MKLLTIVIALFITAQLDAKQKFYKWTDEQGNIHYTEKKPQNIQIEEIKVYKSKSTAIDNEQIKTPTTTPDIELTADQKSVIEYNKAEQKRVKKIQDRENCKIAQKNLETLESARNIKTKNPATGEYIRMDKSETIIKLKQVKSTIRELCR